MFNRLLFLVFTFSPLVAAAQMERTIYHVFEVDSVRSVDLNLAGIYEVAAWAGNSILVETNVQLWHASPEIMQYLIEKGRYDVVADTLSDVSRTIRTKEPNRKPLKNREGVECVEIATARVFVPDTFVVSDDKKRLQRKQ
jgi:hypothetical protein